MKTTKLKLLGCGLASLLLIGCGTTRTTTDSKGPTGTQDSVVTAGVDPRDLARIASEMLESLRTKGTLDPRDKKPVLLGISRFRNDTGLHDRELNMEALVGQIRADLTRDGKVEIEPFYRVGGKPEDQVAYDLWRRKNFLENRPERDPDFTLSGTVLQHRARQGNKTEITYTFQLRLISMATSSQVWEDSREVTKLSKRPIF